MNASEENTVLLEHVVFFLVSKFVGSSSFYLTCCNECCMLMRAVTQHQVLSSVLYVLLLHQHSSQAWRGGKEGESHHLPIQVA